MPTHLTSVYCQTPTKLRHVLRKAARKNRIQTKAMINVDGSPPLFLGAGMIAAGAILYQLRNSRPYVTKDFDIVLSCIAIFAGGILVFQVRHACTAHSDSLHIYPCTVLSSLYLRVYKKQYLLSGMASRPTAAVWSTPDRRCSTELRGGGFTLERNCLQERGDCLHTMLHSPCTSSHRFLLKSWQIHHVPITLLIMV